MKIASTMIALLAATTLPLADARAQDGENFRIRPGIGAQVRPQFPGADSYELLPYLNFSVAREGERFSFGAPDDSLGVKIISSGGFTAGPVIAVEGSRKDSDVGAGVGDVSRTVEVGGFVQQHLGERVRLRAEARRGLGGHNGWIASIGADRVWRDGERYALSFGPRLMLSDRSYQDAFFGVSEEAAARSGLNAFSPDAGLHAVGVTSGAQLSLGGNWGLFGYARYERLVGDARRSPIVREFGSPDQFSGGIGVNRSFTLRL